MEPFEGVIPPELIEDIRTNKCILFVGAGLSCQVKRSDRKNLPNWTGLLDEMLQFAIGNNIEFWGSPTDIEEMIKNYNLLTAAQELQDRLEVAEIDDFLKSVFKDKNVKPTQSHLNLPKIPFRAVLTSNYDTLIESAYTVESKGLSPTVFTQQDLGKISSPLRKEEFYIFKIHGDLNRIDTIVLGSRDYQKLFYKSPDYRQFLETLFSVYTVLFIGFGGSDPDLDNVIERLSIIYSRTIGKHYILLPEKKYNDTEKRRLLLDKRLQVIEYKHDKAHTQVNNFINDLTKAFTNFKPTKKRNESKFDIFLSYSNQDKSHAQRIANYLREKKFSVFFAQEDLALGKSISQSIGESISQAKIMIILLTKNSIDSDAVMQELNLAVVRELENKIIILPILIGDGVDYLQIPSSIQEKVYMKLYEDFGSWQLNQMYDILKKMIAAANKR